MNIMVKRIITNTEAVKLLEVLQILRRWEDTEKSEKKYLLRFFLWEQVFVY